MANTANATATGRVTKILREKGFGFLREDGTGGEYFFHRSSADSFDALREGQPVNFTATTGPKGLRAEDVAPAQV